MLEQMVEQKGKEESFTDKYHNLRDQLIIEANQQARSSRRGKILGELLAVLLVGGVVANFALHFFF